MKMLFPWAIGAALISVSPGFSNDLVKVSGGVSGFTGIKSDDIVDGALVIPTLSADDLFQFNVEQFMGPSETMTVGGLFSAQVPSNFYFPKQKEWSGIFPVSFGKEQFSLMMQKSQPAELIAAWFKIPFDQMVEINNSGAPSTALLPLLSVHKHSFLPEKDWTALGKIDVKLDRDLSTKVKYSWDRAAVSGNDMDGVFLFQATPTNRWAFVNLKGNPAKTGELASMKGLADDFKILFVRTHSTEKDVTSAEGFIRSTTFAQSTSVKGLPSPLEAKLSGSKVTWTPIEAPGWMTVVFSPKDEEEIAGKTLFKMDNLFGGFFGKAEEALQLWIDPKAGTTASLGSNSLNNTDIVISYIGTTEEVPMPEEGQDNSAFLDAASEIRMKKLQ